jgi:signal peptide peptidase SppA
MKPKISQRLASIGPWAIEEQAASHYLAQLEQFDGVVPESAWGDDDSAGSNGYRVENGIAVIEMTGPVTKRPTCASWFFGGCDSLSLRQAVRSADRDESVRGILMVFDSPGGEVAGTSDLAASVANATKPTRAYVSDQCCSAAYWVASQCDQIAAGATAIVGSIGTVMAIRDTSESEAKKGVKVHVISTGPYKGAGSAGSEVTDSHLADFQRVVDQINAEFIGAVAKGRGISTEAAEAVADGRVHVGAAALSAGLIDCITDFDGFLADFTADTTPETKTFTWARAHIATPTTATASTAVTEKKPMEFIKKLLAGLRANPEAAASLAITAEDMSAAEAEITASTTPAIPAVAPAAIPVTAGVDPEIAKQLAALQEQNRVLMEAQVETQAEAFVASAIASAQLSPVQKEPYKALFKAALTADGMTAGANVAALKSAVGSAPPHSYFRPEIAGADPTKTDAFVPVVIAGGEIDKELDRTPLGRRAAAHRQAASKGAK